MTHALRAAKRLVVKIGSALLVDEDSGDVRRDWLDALADDVAAQSARLFGSDEAREAMTAFLTRKKG
jgi:hypothetical protein